MDNTKMSKKSTIFSENENNLFYFESDHLALRGNKDYCDVLKTIVTLSAQREKLLKDYKKILEIRNLVLENPQETLQKIQNNEGLGFELPSSRICSPRLPVIQFDKYGVNVPQPILKEIYSHSVNEVKIQEDIKKEKNDRRTWTVDEQKRLEELLLLYPPEAIERKRYQKIAKALGDRTLAQVTSRVQKYFLKLYRAGLPIPGRIPKSVKNNNRKSALHKHQRFNHYLWKPTTFFPEFTIPVTMDDSENVPGPSSCAPPPTANPSNYLLEDTDYHQPSDPILDPKTVQEMKVQLLLRMRAEKVREKEDPTPAFHHTGYLCAHCHDWPIVGARWHCPVCPGSRNYCTDCALTTTVLYDLHPISHPLLRYLTDELPEDHAECYQKPESAENNLETDSSRSVTNNNSENDTSDCEMECEDDSNTETIVKTEPGTIVKTEPGTIVKTEPGTSEDSSWPATKNNFGSDSRDDEEMGNSVSWSDDDSSNNFINF